MNKRSCPAPNTNDGSRSRFAVIIFTVICLAYLFVTFHRVTPNIIAVDLAKDLSMDAVAIGSMSSIFFFVFGLMQLPSGLLADTLGPRKTTPGFFAVAGLACVYFGMTSSVGALMLSRALMGFGVSVIFVCGVKLLSQWFPPDRFAAMNGLYLGMGGIGLILGSGPLAMLCAALGWRQAMIVTGIVTLAIAALLFVFIFDKPQDKGFAPYQELPPRTRSALDVMKSNLKVICFSWHFWIIAVWFCCHFSIHMAFGGVWGGPFLMDVHGMSRVEAGNVINMMGIGMLAGGPLNGWLSDKVFKARKPVMVINSAGMIACFALLAWLGKDFAVWGCYVWFFAIAAFGMGALSIGFASMRDLYGAATTGTASGLLNAFPSFAVSALQPFTGAVLEAAGRAENGSFTAQGFTQASYIYLILGIIALVAALIVREPMRGLTKASN